MSKNMKDEQSYSEKNIVADVLKSIKETFPQLYATHLSNAKLRRMFVESRPLPILEPYSAHPQKKRIGKANANLRLLFCLAEFLRDAGFKEKRDENFVSIFGACIYARDFALGMAIEWLVATSWLIIVRRFGDKTEEGQLLMLEPDWSIVTIRTNVPPHDNWRFKRAEIITVCLAEYRMIDATLNEIAKTRESLQTATKNL